MVELRHSLSSYEYLSSYEHLRGGVTGKFGKQDLVFSVKLQFGKTLVSVQSKFSLQKDLLFTNFWTKKKYKTQEKFLLQKILGPKILSI